MDSVRIQQSGSYQSYWSRNIFIHLNIKSAKAMEEPQWAKTFLRMHERLCLDPQDPCKNSGVMTHVCNP